MDNQLENDVTANGDKTSGEGSPGEPISGSTISLDKSALMKILGIPALYGVDANQPLSESLFSKYAPHDPEFLTIVRISGSANWQIDINYAHFHLKGDPTATVAAIPADEMRRKAMTEITKDGGRKPFRHAKNALPEMYKWQAVYHDVKDELDVESFNRLGASHPTEMVFWFDIPGAVVDPRNMVSFTPLQSDGKPAAPNDTFTAKHLVDPKHGHMIILRNHYAEMDYATGQYKRRSGYVPLRTYSINLHFTLPLGEPPKPGDPDNRVRIPMVIDPNTGNGGGWEP